MWKRICNVSEPDTRISSKVLFDRNYQESDNEARDCRRPSDIRQQSDGGRRITEKPIEKNQDSHHLCLCGTH